MNTSQMVSLSEINERYMFASRKLKESNVSRFPECSRLDGVKTVQKFLKVIIDCAKGCDNYDFIYFITKLEEQFGASAVPSLWEILNNYMLSDEANTTDATPASDVAFAALYNLIHHYYRAHDEARLTELCGTETDYLGTFFRKKYYLTVELFTRYTDIIHRYDTKYRMNLLLQKYVERGILQKSAALNAAYVSSVCTLCLKKFETEQKIRFSPEKGTRTRLDDNLFIKEYKALSKKSAATNLNVVADWSVALDKALKLVNEAIEFNELYAKYHYLKAQVLFYRYLLTADDAEDIQDEDETYKEIFKELIKAEDRESVNASDYELRISAYKNFEEMVNAYRAKSTTNKQTRNTHRFSSYDEIFNMDTCPSPQYRPPIIFESENYLFVSYSTKDFKPVYHDIIELQLHNVCLWYDKNTVPGETWDSIVEEKIKKCTCFVCYLSENSLKSDAVADELKLAQKYNRPIFAVSLTNDRLPKLFSEIAGDLSTEKIKLASELFDDKKKVIVRDSQYASTSHIPVFISFLEEKFTKVFDKIDVEILCKKNTVPNKPNEDAYFSDKKNNLYVVADGITRPREEYNCEKGSIAALVSREFCKQFAGEFDRILSKHAAGPLNHAQMYSCFSKAFIKANAKVSELIEKEWNGANEKPGCVAVAAAIVDRTLYFGNVGDCVGILVRDGRQIVFAAKQTRYAFQIVGTENDRLNLKQKYVNHPENRYGYGVINGEENAVEFFNVSHLALEPNDTVYLLSDGLSDYVEFSKCSAFVDQNVEELEKTSLADYDDLRKIKAPSARDYDDDRTVIKISITR